MLAAILLILLLALSVPGQAFVPNIQMLCNASVPLVPVLVFYVATIYPLPIALLAATGAGLFWDALWGRLMEDGLSAPLGWTMLLLGIPCAVYHLATIERKNRGLLTYCLLCFFGVMAKDLTDFLWVELHSEAFKFPGSLLDVVVYQRILWTSLLALIAAPFVYLVFHLLGAGREEAREIDPESPTLNSFAK